MYIFAFIVAIILGIVMLVSPQKTYAWYESWKSKNESEPSQSYILRSRISGVLAILIGIAGIIVEVISLYE